MRTTIAELLKVLGPLKRDTELEGEALWEGGILTLKVSASQAVGVEPPEVVNQTNPEDEEEDEEDEDDSVMTVGELIEELQKQDPGNKVSIHIGACSGSAWTNSILEVKDGEIYGWASPDNEKSWMEDGT
jgi:hypothetical protein